MLHRENFLYVVEMNYPLCQMVHDSYGLFLVRCDDMTSGESSRPRRQQNDITQLRPRASFEEPPILGKRGMSKPPQLFRRRFLAAQRTCDAGGEMQNATFTTYFVAAVQGRVQVRQRVEAYGAMILYCFI